METVSHYHSSVETGNFAAEEKAFKAAKYVTSIAITGPGAAEKTTTETLHDGTTMTFYDM